MNERIKELVGRAEAYAYEHEEHWHDGPDWQELFNKKFAELIVLECVSAITDDDLAKDCGTFLMDSYAKGIRYSAEVIKEHFGVRE